MHFNYGSERFAHISHGLIYIRLLRVPGHEVLVQVKPWSHQNWVLPLVPPYQPGPPWGSVVHPEPVWGTGVSQLEFS